MTGDAQPAPPQDAADDLTYWLNYPPTSNSDRYALEQAARAVLTELHVAQAERNALRSAAQTLVRLKDGPRDTEYHEAKEAAWDQVRAALRYTQPAAAQARQEHPHAE